MGDDINGSERYSFSAVGLTSFKRMQIVSTLPVLSKAPTVQLFSDGQVSRPVAGKAKSTFGGRRQVQSRPDIGVCSRCYSAHVLNHTATPTQHSTFTQANNRKLAPTPKNTLHNPIKTPRATCISILQEELKHLAYTTKPYYNNTRNQTRSPPHPKHPK